MTRRRVVGTGGFQRGGVPADGHPSRGATHRASHEHGLHRHMEIDEHGWLQENARDIPTPPTQPLVGPSRGSTAFAGSETGQHGFIVHVRVRQTRTGLRADGHGGDRPPAANADMNTRAKRRTAASRQPSPLRGGQAAHAQLPAPEQIRAAAQEEHREEQHRDLRKGRARHRHHCRGACRRTVQVTNPGTARSRGRGPRTCTPHPCPNRRSHRHSWHLPSLPTRRRRSGLSYTGAHT